MIYPTATELLRNIDTTLTEKIEPSLSDLSGRSSLATVRHLLNFVRVRIEGEGQLLTGEIEATRNLLGDISTYHKDAGDEATASRLRADAEEIGPDHDGRYRSLDDLAQEAGALNELLHGALAELQFLRDRRGATESYKAIRSAIRTHLTLRIEEEGTLVAPAFFGRGPRR